MVRPAYQAGLRRHINSVDRDRRLVASFVQATGGETGIECFDTWAEELVNTGYLHNHARMWFASIWIFTLRLPWELGTDFFLRHLMDGDPASNTLAWRWVAGLQAKGRPYIARVSNISKFTDGRYCPTHQLNTRVTALVEEANHLRTPLPDAADASEIAGEYLLLITEEDMQIGDALPYGPAARVGALATQARSPLPLGAVAQGFARGAMQDACPGGEVIEEGAWSDALIKACAAAGVRTIVTGYAPVGPVAAALSDARRGLEAEGIKVLQVRRSFDTVSWPNATKGFFRMKKEVPSLLNRLYLGL